VDQAAGLQRRPDGADPAVHHVAGGDDVHTGFGLGERLIHQHPDGFVVQDVAGVVQQAVLAVAGEGVERHVGHHAQTGKLFLQRPHHGGHQAVGVGRFAADRVFQRGADHREQRHHRDAQLHAVLGHRQQQVQAQAFHAGHGGHGLAAALAFEHEHRVDQVVDADRVLAHQVAGEFVAAQAARTAVGVGGVQGHAENCARKP
jgi:hypothetical protein